VNAGLATATAERMRAGGKTVEVARVCITEAGRGRSMRNDARQTPKIRAILDSPTPGRGSEKVRNFLRDHVEAGVFDPDDVRILAAAFDSAWQSIEASGANLSDKQIELMRANLAKYIIEQARHGERDQRRLRDGALLHLAQSNLRYPPRDQK
jgi:hypothetical protein